MSDHCHQFAQEMAAAGLGMNGVPIDDGQLHRYQVEGDKTGSRNGWYCLFSDNCPSGVFGSWKTGITVTWSEKRWPSMSPEEHRAHRDRMQAARAKRGAEQALAWQKAAMKAREIYAITIEAREPHAYIEKKQVTPSGVRLHRGSIALPLRNFTGAIESLQFISPAGAKLLLSGGRKRGRFIHVGGDLETPDGVIICEGWATGCTLAEMEPAATVLAAVDAGNLQPVALAARKRWPDARITIAGDDDRQTPGNPGATKARAAAEAAGAQLALPQWPPDAPDSLSDFNDLLRWQRGAA